ncbi:MAG: outer membrane protein assembly factor BamE [Rhizobiales bacterium TMED168]|nr:MAG: outer membrane protein assembly factor BamE [Rhizobiales bacterium TMED168]|tara:strand:+ start:20988 stop:21437 length:450 start_codon:yes stop_codon:yes gene_type:complete
MNYVIKKYLFIVLVYLITSCSPIVENRGYVFDEKLLDQIEINKTISNDVMDILGSPSTTSAIDASTWYYIFSKAETIAFYRPEVTDRRVLAVSFGDDNKVNNLKYYGLEDGKIISYVDRTTPTRGRELTILQQLFGNLGRLGAGSLPGN